MTDKEKIVLAIVCLELLGNFALAAYFYGEMKSNEGKRSKYNELKSILDELNTYLKTKEKHRLLFSSQKLHVL